MEKVPQESSWLIVREPIIRHIFILIFTLGFVGGLLRFLFPFQILNLGGTETFIAWGSSLSSIGQVIGLIALSRIFSSQRTALGISGILFALFILAMGFSNTPNLLLFSRIAEGAGAGLLAIIIIQISSGFEECRGESVGTLLASIFLGSALGQGSAGIVVSQLEIFLVITQTEAIMILGVFTSVVFFLLLFSLMPFIKEIDSYCVSNSNRNHGHRHVRDLLRSLKSKNLIILLAIYILYDCSHGIYTPGLSIMINNNGIPIDQIGLGYLVGDSIWGASQLFTGRFVDRTGSILPLTLSLMAKGVIVIIYPVASSFMVLTSLLALAGLAEGFLEPARNNAAMEFTPITSTQHTHKHYFLGHAPGNPFSLTSHDHEHTHETGSDEIVSILQTLGILGFAIGSSGGGWLLEQGLTLVDLVFVGGVFLILGGLFSVGLRSTSRQVQNDLDRSLDY